MMHNIILPFMGLLLISDFDISSQEVEIGYQHTLHFLKFNAIMIHAEVPELVNLLWRIVFSLWNIQPNSEKSKYHLIAKEQEYCLIQIYTMNAIWASGSTKTITKKFSFQ